eukprot:TRINITY_DN90923_c0_g1_i1.p1 TRINITY_DN90923_c0_g1~~TRINITY_DN90923_c0_g1_i1.p1  ORF type:complete len:1082 (-),score=183.78 TRINITY_DN90923_c0_g1_i1:150-3395(-)
MFHRTCLIRFVCFALWLHLLEIAVGDQWLLADHGDSCRVACESQDLLCKWGDLKTKLCDVDTEAELSEVMESLGVSCSSYSTGNLDHAKSPFYTSSNGACGRTNCGGSKSVDCVYSIEDSKQRLCWCSAASTTTISVTATISSTITVSSTSTETETATSSATSISSTTSASATATITGTTSATATVTVTASTVSSTISATATDTITAIVTNLDTSISSTTSATATIIGTTSATATATATASTISSTISVTATGTRTATVINIATSISSTTSATATITDTTSATATVTVTGTRTDTSMSAGLTASTTMTYAIKTIAATITNSRTDTITSTVSTTSSTWTQTATATAPATNISNTKRASTETITSTSATASITSGTTTFSTTASSTTTRRRRETSSITQAEAEAAKEAAEEAVSALGEQEEAAVADILASVSQGFNASVVLEEPIVITTEEVTVAVISTESVEGGEDGVSIAAPADQSGFAPQVSVSTDTLGSLASQTGGAVVLSAQAVPEELEQLMHDLSLPMEPSNASDTPAEGTPPPKPRKVVVKPLSISLFDAQGKPIQNVQLTSPMILTLAPSVAANTSCAFWNTTNKAWSSEGLFRVQNTSSGVGREPVPGTESDFVDGEPLVCATMHLSIFTGIEGIFMDLAQVVTCSSAIAIFNSELLKNIVKTRWSSHEAGIVLWIFLAVAALSLAVSLIWDHVETEHQWQLKASTQLSPKEHFMLAARRKREAQNVVENEDAESEDEEPSLKQSLCLRLARVFCKCLRQTWRTFMKLLVKSLKLPNSVHTLLLSLPDLPEQFVQNCVRRSQAATLGVHADSLMSVLNEAQVSPEEVEDADAYEVSQQIKDDLEEAEHAFRAKGWFGKALLMALALHPWMIIFEFSARISHTARVALSVSEVLGAAMSNALFYSTSGGALARAKEEAGFDCNPRPGLLTEIVQGVAVATLSCIVSDFVIAFLALIRYVDEDALEQLTPLEKVSYENNFTWRVRLFWFMTFAYIAGCCLLLMAFLANVTREDASTWLTVTAVCLLEDFIILPIALGSMLAFAAVIFSWCTRHRVHPIDGNGRSASAQTSETSSLN